MNYNTHFAVPAGRIIFANAPKSAAYKKFSWLVRAMQTLAVCLGFVLAVTFAQAQSLKTMVVQPTDPPGAPGPVTGPSPVLQGSTQTYTVTAATSATTYTWALSPGGAGALSGTGTSVSIHWSSSYVGSATINCTANNSVGSTAGYPGYIQVTAPVTTLVSGMLGPGTQTGPPFTTLTSTTPSGGNGIYTYQWQSSPDKNTWSAVSYGGLSYTPYAQYASSYYRLITTSGTQSVTSNTVYVNAKVSSAYSSSNNLVSVNQSTGTANVIIPLYTLAAAHITFPINLVYSATGVKGTDVEQNAGLGWSVSLGGAVTRQLRGLPDDVTKDATGAAALGWLYAGSGQKINSLSFANDNNTATCTDEAQDISALSTAFPGNLDKEPDIFQVNAPGLACQLVFDKDNSIRITPFLDLKVAYTIGASGQADQDQITGFTITNDKGVTYTFGMPAAVTQKATTSLSAVNYFQSNYNYFKNGINYYSSWVLTNIADVHGNGISIDYASSPVTNFSNPVQLSIGGAALSTIYTMAGTIKGYQPTGVYCNNSLMGQSQNFQISYVAGPSSGKSCISGITGMGHTFMFGYNQVQSREYSDHSIRYFYRLFLSNIIDETCTTQTVNGQTVSMSSYAPLNLSFNYFNTGNDASTKTDLAGPESYNLDYWGYTNSSDSTNISLLPAIDINPATASYERYRNRQNSPSPSAVYTYGINGHNRIADYKSIIGSLSQINYAEGGKTTFSYEPNDYYDNTLQAAVQGNGIRVYQIRDNDGNPADQDFVRSYNYRDPVTGITTGKAISLPVFAFTTPYSGSNIGAALWTSSTITSPVDLSQEDHTILYGSVTETVNSLGYTVSKFTQPATSWDQSVPVNPVWSPAGIPAWGLTSINVGRPQVSGNCQSLGVLRNDVNTYPFVPNINYDFERGLLTNELIYNSYGTLVSENDYQYSSPGTPTDIAALKYDVNNYATHYAKYIIHTAVGPVRSQVISKTFDLTGVTPGAQATAAQTVTTNYTYNGAQQKLSQQSVINSDGSRDIVNIKYVKDFAITTPGDSYLSALLDLQNKNVNLPVEKTRQYVPVGGSQPLTIGAEMALFATFPNQGINLLGGNPKQVFSIPGTAQLQYQRFVATNGVTNFAPAAVSTSNTFQHDSRYVVSENDIGYDYTGLLLTKDDGFKNLSTTLYDDLGSFRLRANIKNARYDEIALDYPIVSSSFQTRLLLYGKSPNDYNFILSTGGQSYALNLGTVTRKGQACVSLPATDVLKRTVVRNVNAKNYVFSIWVNSSVAGTITVTATDGTNTVSKPVPFNATVGNTNYPTGFQFCKVSIPMTTLTASTSATISFTSNQTINCSDMMAYPDYAEMVTYSYDSNNNKVAETDGNGRCTYYSYDGLGRLRYVYDQDNNIIQRKTYVSNSPALNNTPKVNLTWSPDIVGFTINEEGINFSSSITGNNPCTFNGTSIYNWDFGDGTSSSGNNKQQILSHLYHGNKGQKFTCTLTITSAENAATPYAISTVVTL